MSLATIANREVLPTRSVGQLPERVASFIYKTWTGSNNSLVAARSVNESWDHGLGDFDLLLTSLAEDDLLLTSLAEEEVPLIVVPETTSLVPAIACLDTARRYARVAGGMNLAEFLCSPAILRGDPPYRSPKESCEDAAEQVWLDTNELQYPYRGFSADSANYHLYPEFQSLQLRQAYADYAGAGVDAAQVLIVRGADEGIELMIRAFCTPSEDRIVNLAPTYGMYHLTAAMYSVDVMNIARSGRFDVDVQRLKQQGDGKLIFICSPNNPTGNILARSDLIDLLEHFKERSIIVVDEAYIEFCPKSTCTDLIDKYPNLAVIRTLSKAFGLAALRCGFLVSSHEIVDIVRRVMAPYPVAAPVAQIALQALGVQGRSRMRESVARISATSKDFVGALAKLDCIRSATLIKGNFVLVEFRNESVDIEMISRQRINIRKLLLGHGITNLHRRISIGTEVQMQKLLKVIQAVDSKYQAASMSFAAADQF